MGNFISNFQTTAELATFSATTDFKVPHVSLTKDDKQVHFFKEPYNGHEYVEIGGLKWATMNVGATSITDTGLYFQWGDTQGYTASEVGNTEGKKAFTEDDYKYYDGSAYTKYNDDDGKTILDTSDDAATTALGTPWKMPAKEQLEELINNEYTTSEWIQVDGVYGRRITSKFNGNSIFFPASGECSSGSRYDVDSRGYVWSSSRDPDAFFALYLNFSAKDIYMSSDSRYFGSTIRPVHNPSL